MNPFPRRKSHRRRDRRGVAAVEFALVLPILALVAVAVVDVVDFLRVSMRLERTAGEVANLMAQYETLKAEDVTALFDVARQIAAPYGVTATAGKVYLTSCGNLGSGVQSLGQSSAGSYNVRSAVVCEGQTVRVQPFNAEITLASGQGAVLVEVYLRWEPWVLSRRFFQAQAFNQLWSFAVQRPRLVSILRVPT
ncbi:TadE/TadG family type IV pilus assembly protein [Roseomonas sp. BN140053]|uniref:TadE/TadG family type IV pilus assembly protein n=1 Tax=Roseomonas sp. BN140053 TaxID=3391898 RepID=UPI0039EB9BF8